MRIDRSPVDRTPAQLTTRRAPQPLPVAPTLVMLTTATSPVQPPVTGKHRYDPALTSWPDPTSVVPAAPDASGAVIKPATSAEHSDSRSYPLLPAVSARTPVTLRSSWSILSCRLRFRTGSARWSVGLQHERRVVISRPSRSALLSGSMTDTDYLDHQPGIENLIDDPVVANPNSIRGVLAGQSHTSRRPGLVSEQIDRSPDPLLFLAIQLRDRLDRASRDLNGVAVHASPSAALTSSQGT